MIGSGEILEIGNERGAGVSARGALSVGRSFAARCRRWAVEPQPNLLTKALAELVGCMIFHFIGSVSPTPLTNATVLVVLVYYTARMSGAHLNPALSVTFAMLGYINPVELLVYWISQMVGSIFGALWIAALLPYASIRGEALSATFGCFAPSENISNVQIFGWEAVCTFAFILPIFSVVWYTQSKSGYGNTGPLIVGLSLYASASAAGMWTGGALNPARVLASPAVFVCPYVDKLHLYVLGQLVGAAVVPLAIIPWYGVSSHILGDLWDSSKSTCSEEQLSLHKSDTPERSNRFAEQMASGAEFTDDIEQQQQQQQQEHVLQLSPNSRDKRGSMDLLRRVIKPLIDVSETNYTCSIAPKGHHHSANTQGNSIPLHIIGTQVTENNTPRISFDEHRPLAPGVENGRMPDRQLYKSAREDESMIGCEKTNVDGP